MTDRNRMMDSLVAATPGFASEYSGFLDEWAHETEVPYYLALAGYSRFLIALLESESHSELAAGFKNIELLIAMGDADVRTAVVVGILESLQNTNLHSTTSPIQFLAYLGPTSRKYWDRVADFWEKGTIISDE